MTVNKKAVKVQNPPVAPKAEAPKPEAPKAEAPKPKVAAKPKAKISPILDKKYKMGTGKYNPRAEHNAIAWENVTAAITIAGKGTATHGELLKTLTKHATKWSAETEENHHDFIGYLERRDAIAVAK